MRLILHLIAIVASFIMIPVINPESFDAAAMLWANFFFQLFWCSAYCKRDLERSEKTHNSKQ